MFKYNKYIMIFYILLGGSILYPKPPGRIFLHFSNCFLLLIANNLLFVVGNQRIFQKIIPLIMVMDLVE